MQIVFACCYVVQHLLALFMVDYFFFHFENFNLFQIIFFYRILHFKTCFRCRYNCIRHKLMCILSPMIVIMFGINHHKLLKGFIRHLNSSHSTMNQFYNKNEQNKTYSQTLRRHILRILIYFHINHLSKKHMLDNNLKFVSTYTLENNGLQLLC